MVLWPRAIRSGFVPGADCRRCPATAEIGAPTERVRVSGNLKFDIRPNAQPALITGLRAAIGKGSPIIVCGSTAEGEEEPLLAAFKAVQQQFPRGRMILAPGILSALKKWRP